MLPKRTFSRCSGFLTRINLPGFVITPLLQIFCRLYRVDLSEMTRPLQSYRSFSEFFTRDIKRSIRPVGPSPVSPVDGTLRSYGPIQGQLILDVKGQRYSVDELVGNSSLAAAFLGGVFFNFYLAPGDYHHVHAPISAEVIRLIHVPGDLWPVNDWALANVSGLFQRNERVSMILESALGRIGLILVGAFNVGSISLERGEITTNRFGLGQQRVFEQTPGRYTIEPGERVGTFNFGSSVIVLLEPGAFDLSTVAFSPGSVVRYGQSLRTFAQ